MSFQLRVEGPASADLAQILRAVEGKLGWHAVQAQEPADRTPASVASGACVPGVNCPTSIGGHDVPEIVLLVIVAVVAFIVGYIIGRQTAKSSVQK
jgi:hypothetical protein